MDAHPSPLPEPVATNALKALKLVIASDALTRFEMEALAGARAAFPVGDDAWREVEQFDVRGTALQEILPPLEGPLARLWLHEAIRACWADDVYSNKEQAALAHAAALLGIPPSLRRSFEALVTMERTVAELRAALLSG
jgi:hypothetical protein